MNTTPAKTTSDFGRFPSILRGGGSGGERLAAAAERAQAEVPARGAHERAIRDVAAGVAGPLLVAYVLWLLLDAKARGIRRLYFLSRDGEVLAEIADILAPRLGIDIDRHYLYASRQAWNRAAGVEALDRWVWHDTVGSLTLADLLRRMDVPADTVATDLAAAGYSNLDTELEKPDRLRLQELFAQGWLAKAAAAAQTKHRDLLLSYLAQEGVFEPVPKAMVDLGWSGSQHETLCDVLVEQGVAPFPCYLFGAKAFTSPWFAQRRGFYFDEGYAPPGLNRSSNQLVKSHALAPSDLYLVMETFCSALHGSLAGFRQAEDKKIEPDLAPARSEELIAWGLPLMRRTFLAVAAGLDVSGIEASDLEPGRTPAMRRAVDGLLEAFWHSPTREEAAAWGAFPWDSGQGHEAGSVPLAEPYDVADIPTTWARGTLRKRSLFWVKGALALTSPPLATTLRGVSLLRRNATKLALPVRMIRQPSRA